MIFSCLHVLSIEHRFGHVNKIQRLSQGFYRVVATLREVQRGKPLGGASIASELTTAESDEGGNFQLEAGAAELLVRTEAGDQCSVDLSSLDMSVTFKGVGVLVCRPPE